MKSTDASDLPTKVDSELPPVSKTNTKAEIFEAYEATLKQLRARGKDKPQTVQVTEEKRTLVKKADELTEESLIKNSAELKIRIASLLERVDAALLEEYRRYADLCKAIEIGGKELEDLYQIKAQADSLAAMILAQEDKKQAYEEERKQRETEKDEQKAAWEKEKIRIQQEIKEEKERLLKARQRDEEEYRYNLQLARKKEQDEHEAKRKAVEKEWIEKQTALEKDFREREEAIKSAENELTILRQKIEAFPTELQKASAEAVKNAVEKLSLQFKHEKELMTKETEGTLRLKDQTIQTLEAKIKEQEAFVKQLNQKAETSDKSVKDIAIKAIESSTKTTVIESAGSGKRGNEPA